MEEMLRIITCSFLSWLEKILFGGNERDLKFSEWDFFFFDVDDVFGRIWRDYDYWLDDIKG